MIKKITDSISIQTFMDNMPAVIYLFTKDGRLVSWNKKAEEVFEYSADEMINKISIEFVAEEDRENVMQAFQSVLTTGFAQAENLSLTKSGKKIPYIGSVQLVVIDGVEYLIGMGIDISELYSARKKIIELNELLNAENIYLKDQLELSDVQHEIIGVSDALKYVLYKIKQVAQTDVAVLIEGETGTGKELIARAIHKESSRKDKKFIKVNCASIPENLIESELFGHEKGSFTGAIEKRIGRFELADGGTLFLDEIGELPLNLQPKLLHVLQQGEFERIGSSKTIKTNVRIIAATNKVLEDEIKKGHFRNDLYYRLDVFPISVSPLRERKEDITPLVEHYIKIYSLKLNRPIKMISKSAMKRLINYSWPGNVRELENVIERAIINSQNGILNFDFLPISVEHSNKFITLEEAEKNHITEALRKSEWKINGSGGAAEKLKLNPQTLRSKMQKLGIKRDKLH